MAYQVVIGLFGEFCGISLGILWDAFWKGGLGMRPLDPSGLARGLLVVIGIAMALGRLDELKHWAAREAFGVSRGTHFTRYAIYGRMGRR